MAKEKSILERVLRFREAGAVERAHTVRHTPGYTVGRHSFDMVLLLDTLHPNPPIELYQACIRHDLHERWTGDIPTPAKKLVPLLGTASTAAAMLVEETVGIVYSLGNEEERWLNALDVLEFHLWTLDELNAGNDHVQRCADDSAEALREMDLPFEVEQFRDLLFQMGWFRTDERIG